MEKSEKMVKYNGVYMNESDFVAQYKIEIKTKYPLSDSKKVVERGKELFNSANANQFS